MKLIILISFIKQRKLVFIKIVDVYLKKWCSKILKTNNSWYIEDKGEWYDEFDYDNESIDVFKCDGYEW